MNTKAKIKSVSFIVVLLIIAFACVACAATLEIDVSAVGEVWCVGYEYDLSGLIINLKRGIKRTRLSLDEVTVSDVDTATLGEKTLTVTYGKLSRSMKVVVADANIVTYIDGDFVKKEIVYKGECAEDIVRESTDTSFFCGWYLIDAPYDFLQAVSSPLTLTAHRIGVNEYRQIVKSEFNNLYQQWTAPNSQYSYLEADLLNLQTIYQNAYDTLDSLDTVTKLTKALSDLQTAFLAIPTESVRVDEYCLTVKGEFEVIFAEWKKDKLNYTENDYQTLLAVYQQAYDALDQLISIAQLQQALADLPKLLAAVPKKKERAKEQLTLIYQRWISPESPNKYLEEDFADLQTAYQNAYNALDSLDEISDFEKAIQDFLAALAVVPTAIDRINEYEANFDYNVLTAQEAAYVRDLFNNAREEILLSDGGAPSPDYIFYMLKTYTSTYKK